MTSTTTPVFLRDSSGTLHNATYIRSISTPDPFYVHVEMADDETLEFRAVRAPHEGEDRPADLVSRILEIGKLGGGVAYWTGKTFETH
ncbi:hypothetical protein [Paenarthrobacter nicotinovorans]|uniref:hypothetical protein n=1 Tax=Paenarthrobacter nicotinovorans TaxID=29320 RepID=UPI003D67BC8F